MSSATRITLACQPTFRVSTIPTGAGFCSSTAVDPNRTSRVVVAGGGGSSQQEHGQFSVGGESVDEISPPSFASNPACVFLSRLSKPGWSFHKKKKKQQQLSSLTLSSVNARSNTGHGLPFEPAGFSACAFFRYQFPGPGHCDFGLSKWLVGSFPSNHLSDLL